MLDCPECGKPVDGMTCKACGFIDLPAEGTTSHDHEPVRDPFWGYCEHYERGLRCSKPGSVSRDTSGPMGDSKWKRKWFCFDHAFPGR